MILEDMILEETSCFISDNLFLLQICILGGRAWRRKRENIISRTKPKRKRWVVEWIYIAKGGLSAFVNWLVEFQGHVMIDLRPIKLQR